MESTKEYTMTMPKKKTRTITVDDKKYRYLVKGPNKTSFTGEGNEVSVLVQEETKAPGNILCLHGIDYGVEITPKNMRLNIRNAIEQGWEPSKRGKAIRIKYLYSVFSSSED